MGPQRTSHRLTTSAPSPKTCANRNKPGDTPSHYPPPPGPANPSLTRLRPTRKWSSRPQWRDHRPRRPGPPSHPKPRGRRQHPPPPPLSTPQNRRPSRHHQRHHRNRSRRRRAPHRRRQPAADRRSQPGRAGPAQHLSQPPRDPGASSPAGAERCRPGEPSDAPPAGRLSVSRPRDLPLSHRQREPAII